MFIADLHNDLVQRMMIGEDVSKYTNVGHTDIPRLQESSIDMQVMIVWVSNKLEKYEYFARANKMHDKITDLNKIYLKNKKLHVESFGRGFAWLDTGTPDSLLSANNFIGTIEKRQGLKVACLEEIAFNNDWINKVQLNKLKDKISNGPYKDYLIKILKK